VLGEQHVDGFAQGRRDVLADVVRPDRQLAVAAVDQDGQLHGPGPAEVGEGVQGRPHRPPGEQDVVDEHDEPAIHPAGRQVGLLQSPRRLQPQVVAVERGVQAARRHLVALEGQDARGQAPRQRPTPGGNAE